IARCEHHKKIAKIAASTAAQPSDILNAGQRVVGIAANCEKLLMNRAAEERAGDFLAHQVSCDVIRKGHGGVRIHGKTSKAERMLERLLLYAHLKKIQWYQPNLVLSGKTGCMSK